MARRHMRDSPFRIGSRAGLPATAAARSGRFAIVDTSCAVSRRRCWRPPGLAGAAAAFDRRKIDVRRWSGCSQAQCPARVSACQVRCSTRRGVLYGGILSQQRAPVSCAAQAQSRQNAARKFSTSSCFPLERETGRERGHGDDLKMGPCERIRRGVFWISPACLFIVTDISGTCRISGTCGNFRRMRPRGRIAKSEAACPVSCDAQRAAGKRCPIYFTSRRWLESLQ